MALETNTGLKSQKKQLRKTIKKLKQERLNPDFRKEHSLKLTQKLTALAEFQKAKTIFIYWALSDEIDTKYLLESTDKKFLLPVIVGNDLVLKEFLGKDSLKKETTFGILEPTGEIFTDYNQIDLAIIPGVAFDKHNNRLGRGKGFYDKTLINLKNCFRIGICFDFQLVEKIPAEEHDILMNMVISS